MTGKTVRVWGRADAGFEAVCRGRGLIDAVYDCLDR